MAEITLEKTHALLQSLAEYVMTNVATKQELEQTRLELLEKLDQKADKADLEEIKKKLDQKADKADLEEIKKKLDQKADKTDIVKIADSVAKLQIDMQDVKVTQQTMINSMDAQAKQLDSIRTEQVAFTRTINRHEERITALEENETSYRVRDKED